MSDILVNFYLCPNTSVDWTFLRKSCGTSVLCDCYEHVLFIKNSECAANFPSIHFYVCSLYFPQYPTHEWVFIFFSTHFLQWLKPDSITLACCSLGSSHHPLSYSPSTSRGDGLSSSSIAQRCVFHMNNPPSLKCTQLPPSTSSTPTTTPMLECSLKARAPSRSSVFSGSLPGNVGWTDKKTG